MVLPIFTPCDLPPQQNYVEHVVQQQEIRSDRYEFNEVSPEDLTELIERIDKLASIKCDTLPAQGIIRDKDSLERYATSDSTVSIRMSVVFSYYDLQYASLDTLLEAKYEFIKTTAENPFDMIAIYTHRENELLTYLIHIDWREPVQLEVTRFTERDMDGISPEQFEAEYGKTFRTYSKKIQEDLRERFLK